MVTRARASWRAFTLLEVLIAVLLLSLCAVAMIGALNQGAAGAARASEAQLASVLAARLVDRIVAMGYGFLSERAGTSAQVPLPLPTGAPGLAPEEPEADGLSYQAVFQVEERAPGLLRVSLLLAWRRPGTSSGQGSMTALRYVASPTLALEAR
jgi:prepilin-type N-terminal cleavage/methylation domain-containing protein